MKVSENEKNIFDYLSSPVLNKFSWNSKSSSFIDLSIIVVTAICVTILAPTFCQSFGDICCIITWMLCNVSTDGWTKKRFFSFFLAAESKVAKSVADNCFMTATTAELEACTPVQSTKMLKGRLIAAENKKYNRTITQFAILR